MFNCYIGRSRLMQASNGSPRPEKILGHFPSDVWPELIARPQLAEQRIKAAEGAEGLIIFSMFDHGAALNMASARANAKQYLIGNPLTAISMTRHDIRAALYAPLRVLVFEPKVGRTIVEYDQPSSQFGQFGCDGVTRVALTLDAGLERVLARAAELSLRSDSKDMPTAASAGA
jgi:uncharacterized protein (DUF302 family)